MGRPVTRVEILLHEIAGTLTEIRDLLQQDSAQVRPGAATKSPAPVRPAKKAAAGGKKS